MLTENTWTMAGASGAHVKVTGNAYALLKNYLCGFGCTTYIADMKLRVDQDEAFFYPDVMVCYDSADQLPEQDLVKNSPKLIIEMPQPKWQPNVLCVDRYNRHA